MAKLVIFFTQLEGHELCYSANLARVNYTADLAAVLGVTDASSLESVLDSYVKQGILIPPHVYRHGIASVYHLTEKGYNISLQVLRRRAEEDTRETKDIPLKDLHLNARILYVLSRAHISNVAELLEVMEPGLDSLRKLRNIGEASLKEILDKTAFYRERTKEAANSG